MHTFVAFSFQENLLVFFLSGPFLCPFFFSRCPLLTVLPFSFFFLECLSGSPFVSFWGSYLDHLILLFGALFWSTFSSFLGPFSRAPFSSFGALFFFPPLFLKVLFYIFWTGVLWGGDFLSASIWEPGSFSLATRLLRKFFPLSLALLASFPVFFDSKGCGKVRSLNNFQKGLYLIFSRDSSPLF